MKKHAIIPIFIPNMGCAESCVFCDQKQITARDRVPTLEEVQKTILEWLSTLEDAETVEIAFYGGSFTAIPSSMQENYLKVAYEYIERGQVDGIHISTRPDCIDIPTLELLRKYGVKVIELGVQSFDDRVLSLSKRGHDSKAIYRACELIKEYSFSLGIQLMIGLPGDSMESCLFSAKETAKIGPDLARLYPCIVLPNTELMTMFEEGVYSPLTRREALARTTAMYRILDEAGIYIMRVGLKSTDIINNDYLGDINQGAYHPAFRQLVEGEIIKEEILAFIDAHPTAGEIEVHCALQWISNAVGHKGSNKEYFYTNYPDLKIEFIRDENISNKDRFIINAKEVNYD